MDVAGPSGRRQQVGRDRLDADPPKVAVRVDEAGEKRLAGQVHDLRRARPSGLSNVGLRADGDDLAVLHRHGLGGRVGVVDREMSPPK